MSDIAIPATDADLIKRLLSTHPSPAECLVAAARLEQLIDALAARTDLCQAAVAAALEAAANAAWLAGPSQDLSHEELSDVGKERRATALRCEAAIRALITQRDHDALAAHVAAEVAKARAELLKEISAYLKTDNHDGTTHRVIDIAYNAFMYGASKRNSEDGGPCDWFTDTRPFIIGRIDAISEALAQIGAKP